MKYLIILFAFITINVTGQEMKVGDKAPDIVMENLNGEKISLSSLKGKVVLIDFWASWCRPCRMENPEIVKTYQEYKDAEFENGTGFTVFSVSLDNNATAWQKAVQKDELIWEYHVSDLKGWENAAAREYQVSSIPQSYLIDGDGQIIAINLRGGALEKELKKIRKKGGSFLDFWFSNE